MPAAVLHPYRGIYADALVVCRLSDFAQLAGAVDSLELLGAKKGEHIEHPQKGCSDRSETKKSVGEP